jgi:hypothetical protein
MFLSPGRIRKVAVALRPLILGSAAPRIALIISQTFEVDIDKNVVYRVLSRHYRPASGGTGPF